VYCNNVINELHEKYLENICRNENIGNFGINIIKKKQNKLTKCAICCLCCNKKAIKLINDNIDKITNEGLNFLCANGIAIDLITSPDSRLTQYQKQKLLAHSHLINLVKDNFDLENLSFDEFRTLCENYDYLDVVDKCMYKYITNIEQTNEIFEYLCFNKNPKAINIINKHIDMTKLIGSDDFDVPCYAHITCLDIIKPHAKNFSKLNYCYLASNPNIFTYDYEKIKNSKQHINKEHKKWFADKNKQKIIKRFKSSLFI
jgi:hypothetical protein